MVLNADGEIANHCWKNIPNHFPNTTIEHWMVMPNHVHGIIYILEPENCSGSACRTTTEKQGTPSIGSIPTIIRSFKSALTREINIRHGTPSVPVWQANYYEHIIRNEIEYIKLLEYIQNNPLQWPLDQYYAGQG